MRGVLLTSPPTAPPQAKNAANRPTYAPTPGATLRYVDGALPYGTLKKATITRMRSATESTRTTPACGQPGPDWDRVLELMARSTSIRRTTDTTRTAQRHPPAPEPRAVTEKVNGPLSDPKLLEICGNKRDKKARSIDW